MTDRALALGDQLVQIHDVLRRDLAALRSGGVPAADLRVHCLAFCGSLTAHHTREDGAFPEFERQMPELGPVLARLRREHAAIARRIEDGIDDLDQLATELEAHLRYEEEQLVPALNRL
jgi:iron-sulfur cluster repair protein YtfE (RIC family)